MEGKQKYSPHSFSTLGARGGWVIRPLYAQDRHKSGWASGLVYWGRENFAPTGN